MPDPETWNHLKQTLGKIGMKHQENHDIAISKDRQEMEFQLSWYGTVE